MCCFSFENDKSGNYAQKYKMLSLQTFISHIEIEQPVTTFLIHTCHYFSTSDRYACWITVQRIVIAQTKHEHAVRNACLVDREQILLRNFIVTRLKQK